MYAMAPMGVSKCSSHTPFIRVFSLLVFVFLLVFAFVYHHENFPLLIYFVLKTHEILLPIVTCTVIASY